jgi:lipopolysaccharide export system ATP-binding protein
VSMESTLKAIELSKSFDSRRVVDHVSFEMNTGEIVGLFGPNGAGKTTTFYSVIGFVRPDSGKITIDDEDITYLPMFMRARRGITYLPQEPSVFRRLSVANNLKSVLEFHETDREKIEHKVQELLETFKLEQLAGNNADLLSGGERRRLEIARALMMAPRFILLDEPFSGIDPISVADLKKIVNGLKKRGIGILLSDHNVRESLPICDRAYIMSEGKIILEGDPSRIVNNKVVREVYLGEEFYLDVGA